MLTIEDLEVSYTGKNNVLDGLNLKLETGKVHGLIGLNGSGKTTLLHCLNGMVNYQRGRIYWNGEVLKPGIVLVLETENYFYPGITGGEYLKLFKALQPQFALTEWNKLFDLPLNEFIENYSTGMRKKLALMAALSFDSPVLILDEPFNGLDLETVQLIKTIVVQLKSVGRTILLTSHILESLLTSCDTIHYLHNKRIERTFFPEQYDRIEQELFELSNKRNSQLVADLLSGKAK